MVAHHVSRASLIVAVCIGLLTVTAPPAAAYTAAGFATEYRGSIRSYNPFDEPIILPLTVSTMHIRVTASWGTTGAFTRTNVHAWADDTIYGMARGYRLDVQDVSAGIVTRTDSPWRVTARLLRCIGYYTNLCTFKAGFVVLIDLSPPRANFGFAVLSRHRVCTSRLCPYIHFTWRTA